MATRFRTWTKGVHWKPVISAQKRAIECEADELYYGGEAGGGKTDLLLGLGFTEGRNSVLFRWQAVQLRDVVRRSKEIVGDSRWFNGTSLTWSLPGGRVFEFGGIGHTDDVEKWQGRPHDHLLFDEAAHFPEHTFLFLCGWNRGAPGQRTRVVLGGNPPLSDEGIWLYYRYAAWLNPDHEKPAKPGEIRWFVRHRERDVEVEPSFSIVIGNQRIPLSDCDSVEYSVERLPRAMYAGVEYVAVPDLISLDGSETGPVPARTLAEYQEAAKRESTYLPRSRTFIPASRHENPFLGAEYEGLLDQMPEPMRSLLKSGYAVMRPADDAWQLYSTELIEAAFNRWEEKTFEEAGRMDAIGIDVARGGIGETVLSRRHGDWFAKLIKIPGKDTPRSQDTAKLIVENHHGEAVILVDAGGPGAGVFDVISDSYSGVPIIDVNFGEGSDYSPGEGLEPEFDENGEPKKKLGLRMRNVRAAMHWQLRERLIRGDIALPPDDDLRRDLKAIRWSILPGGKVAIEKKEDITTRTGRGLHASDAVILASWTGYDLVEDVSDYADEFWKTKQDRERELFFNG